MPSGELLVMLFSTALPLLVIAVIVGYSLRILREYERGVVFLLGRFWPRIEDGVMRLTPAQLSALVEGLDWARVAPREVERPRAAQ